MSSFACYRLPRGTHYTQVIQTDGEPLQLLSPAGMNNRQGFVVAPFAPKSEEPILVIQPDRIITKEVADFVPPAVTGGIAQLSPTEGGTIASRFSEATSGAAGWDDYYSDFTTFHHALQGDQFQKLVLARCATEPNDGRHTAEELFLLACQRYPRMFVALVSTPQSGTWLTATPEILLEGDGCQWRTIALAGTMRLRDDELTGEGQHLRWSTKNIEEQRHVASYIADRLKQLGIDFKEEGPRTTRAANLVHLRSDFTFPYINNVREGDIINALHPTPAVCGLPKAEAFSFINTHEHARRHYYSGFMGPLNMPQQQTHLYVSLRCMQITDSTYSLYAGGGLLRGSQAEKEWLETEAKMETMRNLLYS